MNGDDDIYPVVRLSHIEQSEKVYQSAQVKPSARTSFKPAVVLNNSKLVIVYLFLELNTYVRPETLLKYLPKSSPLNVYLSSYEYISRVA